MKEKIIYDRLLGKLSWNEDLDWYEGNVTIYDRPVSIYFSFEEIGTINEDDFTTMFDIRHSTYYYILNNEKRLRQSVAKEFLEIYNRSWTQDDRIGLEEFTSQIFIEGIHFCEDGDTDIYFNDNNLFLGHSLVLEINKNREIENISLQG